ncbi:MAG: hypothetical protein MUF63_07405 [Rhodobacteraceae bacterium]|jgi:hypothetical protein|nr:hypothetical protein [Paracoccaceae bacterium]
MKNARPRCHEPVEATAVSRLETLFDVAEEREFVRVSRRNLAPGKEQYRKKRRLSHRS